VYDITGTTASVRADARSARSRAGRIREEFVQTASRALLLTHAEVAHSSLTLVRTQPRHWLYAEESDASGMRDARFCATFFCGNAEERR